MDLFEKCYTDARIAMAREAEAGILDPEITYDNLDDAIVPERDFEYGYFGSLCWFRGYLWFPYSFSGYYGYRVFT